MTARETTRKRGRRDQPLDLIEAITAQLATHAEALLALGRELTTLPHLSRDWTGDGLPLKADLIESPVAYVASWLRYTDILRPSPTVAIKRTASDFGEFPWEQVDLLAQQAAVTDIRMIIDSPDTGAHGRFDQPTRAALDHLAAHGLKLRVMDDPPTTLFATSDGTTALPNTWGPVQPTSMLVLISKPVATVVTAWFDALWAHATPYGTNPRRWAPVLDLLDQGLDDHQIATTLGWSTRTVRRRITEAMDELAAPNRFALGRAWATQQQRSEQRRGRKP